MRQIELPVGLLFGDSVVKYLFINKHGNEIRVVEMYYEHSGKFRQTHIFLNKWIMMLINYVVRKDENDRLWFDGDNLISAQLWR